MAPSNESLGTLKLLSILPVFNCDRVSNKAPQFQKVCLGNEVGSNMDQNEPLRLGFRSFASKLMDHDSIKVLVF